MTETVQGKKEACFAEPNVYDSFIAHYCCRKPCAAVPPKQAAFFVTLAVVIRLVLVRQEDHLYFVMGKIIAQMFTSSTTLVDF